MKKIFTTLIITFLSLFWFTQAAAELPRNINKIYFFGDSLSDMGNYQDKECPRCYADPSAPVTNWTTGKETHTAKQTWAYFLGQHYGISVVKSNDGGSDYAISGATTGPSKGKEKRNVLYEVNEFLKNTPNPDDPTTTLYVIWEGANDFLDLKPGQDPQKAAMNAISNIIHTIKLLYDHGARIFLVLGLPDISETPLYADFTPAERAKMRAQIQTYNHSLFDPNGLLSTVKNASGVTLYVYTFLPEDGENALDQIAENPTSFGFPATIGGQPNNDVQWFWGQHGMYGPDYTDDPDQYVFYDLIHPTTHGHMIMMQFVEQKAQLF